MTKELDLIVIGGGPAGLSAGLAAAQAGVQVTILDAYPVPGGQYYRQPPEYNQSQPSHRQLQGRQLWHQVQQAGGKIINDALVWYVDGNKHIIATTPDGTYEVNAKTLILASGAYERPVPFPGWTLPGVILTSGAQTLLYQHVIPGKKVLLAGTGPLQLVVAKKLLEAGADVASILEGNQILARAFRHTYALWGQWERMNEGITSYLTLLKHQVPYRLGWGILEAHGDKKVTSATIARLDDQWYPIPGSHQQIECDTICIGYGFIPFNSLSRQMGARQIWNEALGGIVPVRDIHFQTSIQDVYAVGDGAGIGGIRMSIIEGTIAGITAASSLGHPTSSAILQKMLRKQYREQAFQRLWMDLFTPGPGAFELANDETLVCRCEGITKKKLADAISQGAKSMIELKSITRCGMGECQGRICEQTILHYLSMASQKPIDAIDSYHLRPPLFPIPVETLAHSPIE